MYIYVPIISQFWGGKWIIALDFTLDTSTALTNNMF